MKANRQINPTKYMSFSINMLTRLTALALMLVHIFFMVMFKIYGVKEMFMFNIFSSTFYALLAFLTNNKPHRLNAAASITIIEIVVHAALATIFCGWDCGFMMFIICVAPFPFFLPYKSDFSVYIMNFFCGASFVAVKIFMMTGDRVIYDDISEKNANYTFLFNCVLSFLLITTFSTIYKVKKRLDEMELIDKNESLSILAKIDPLSQLFNRRAMIDFLQSIEKNCKVKGESFVIAMGDLDNFKHVNDTYGHSKGDEVIKAVSEIMMTSVPTEGYVCRWGGEELLFAIPSAAAEDGVRVAESIRAQLAAKKFSSEGESFRITITFGICECDGSFSYERALTVADRRLYYGKEHGKDRVIAGEEAGEE